MQTQSTFRGSFQPVVLDEKGSIRKRLTALKKKTRIEKQLLASQVFEIGLTALEGRLAAEAGK